MSCSFRKDGHQLLGIEPAGIDPTDKTSLFSTAIQCNGCENTYYRSAVRGVSSHNDPTGEQDALSNATRIIPWQCKFNRI